MRLFVLWLAGGDKGDRDDMGDMGNMGIKDIKGDKAHKAVSPKEPAGVGVGPFGVGVDSDLTRS